MTYRQTDIMIITHSPNADQFAPRGSEMGGKISNADPTPWAGRAPMQIRNPCGDRSVSPASNSWIYFDWLKTCKRRVAALVSWLSAGRICTDVAAWPDVRSVCKLNNYSYLSTDIRNFSSSLSDPRLYWSGSGWDGMDCSVDGFVNDADPYTTDPQWCS